MIIARKYSHNLFVARLLLHTRHSSKLSTAAVVDAEPAKRGRKRKTVKSYDELPSGLISSSGPSSPLPPWDGGLGTRNSVVSARRTKSSR